jgi:ribonuclease J
LRHRNAPVHKKIDDPKKLIKKWEIPVRVFWLWWLEQIWSNMTVVEYMNDIIIVDAWMEFADDSMPWVDYIIPDISYLMARKKNIKGIIITHGHLDHIWAVKNIISNLDYPTIYTSPLTIWMIKRSLNDKDNKSLKYKQVDPDIDVFKLWVFTLEFFRVNHSIPESMGVSVHTPKWLLVFSWDFKIDFTPAIDKPADLWKISRIGQEWVKMFLWESTNFALPFRKPLTFGQRGCII